MSEQFEFLTRTVDLAEAGRGAVFPNPMVGALVVKEGQVVATGYHGRYGSTHAEAAALEAAGERARESTLYCNLEPCSYESPEKHQPPCIRRIIEAGVRKVVIGQLDPNPRVRGRGVRILKEAGIEVVTAADSEPYWRFNDAFNSYMSTGRPFVQIKLAMSLDGRIATSRGDSKWITDESARREVHALRAERDAVAVGVGTVIADDPSLTVRLVEGRNPQPVVFDTNLRIPLDRALLRDRSEELIVLAGRPPAEDPAFNVRKGRLEALGVTVKVVPVERGEVSLPEALTALRAEGINSLLLEGGATLATSFLRIRLFDRLTTYIAPILIGSGTEAIGELGIAEVAQALCLEGVTWRQVGNQQVFDGYRPGWLNSTQASVQEETHVYGTC
mgnify:CR=1 FL=1